MELQKLKKNLHEARRQSIVAGDQVDALPAVLSFTKFDIFVLVVSMISFLVDTGTDITVAVIHFEHGNMWYFGLTVTFIAVPTLVMTTFSIYWYVTDMKNEEVRARGEKVSAIRWTIRIILLLLQLGPLLRYIDSLWYGLKVSQSKRNPREQRRFYELMIYEDLDATMLRLFECFMEAAPQLLLQLYIIVKNYNEYTSNDFENVLFQAATVLMSLISMAWSLVSYQRSLRLALTPKRNMTWTGTAVYFLWRFFVIASRVEALALFASLFPIYVAIVCIAHWAFMLFWILSMKTEFCSNRLAESGYNAILAVIFIFCYFNPVDSPTRYRMAVFYCVCLIENTLLMFLWYTYRDASQMPYHNAAIMFHYGSFFFGIMFMIIYYLLLHPTGDIPFCRDRCKLMFRRPAENNKNVPHRANKFEARL